MNLFDILALDERVIVLSDPGERIIYTWNQSLTLQCWQDSSVESFSLQGEWEEIACRTLSDVPESFRMAKKSAQEWKNS